MPIWTAVAFPNRGPLIRTPLPTLVGPAAGLNREWSLAHSYGRTCRKNSGAIVATAPGLAIDSGPCTDGHYRASTDMSAASHTCLQQGRRMRILVSLRTVQQ